jgi:hypothetical protein
MPPRTGAVAGNSVQRREVWTLDDLNFLCVTVSRMDEDPEGEPQVAIPAYGVTARLNGTLSIQSEGGERSFSTGSWEAFEVRRLANRRPRKA